MSNEPTMEQREKAFTKYLQERLFGLVAVVEKPSPDEQFPHASGVVLDIQGFFLLVTVAHFLDDVIRWKEEGRLLQLSLVVHHETGYSSAIELDLNKILPCPHKSVDVGFMLLPKEVVAKIDKYGGKATKKEHVDLPSDQYPRYYLVGQAAAYTKVRQETIASDGQSKWVLNHVSGTPVVISSLRFLGDGDSEHTYRFAPHQGILSYSGCSGGPIFGYSDGSKIMDYSFVGIQSKQILDATPEQKPKELIASSAMFAVLSMDSYLEDVFGPLDAESGSGEKESEGG
jgi:hypothetical protein